MIGGTATLPAAAQKIELLPGFTQPEDMEFLPGTGLIIVSNMWSATLTRPAGLSLFDPKTNAVSWLPITNEYEKGWGAADCTTPLPRIGPHGIHLKKRRDGRLELFVVNHADRESIEMLEIKVDAPGPRAIWRGCTVMPNPEGTRGFNDVAGLRDGGFIATVPIVPAIYKANGNDPRNGKDSGYIVEWHPGGTVVELPDSHAPFPNGVQLSDDEKTLYFNAWTALEVRRYDRAAGRVTGHLTLDFMPDNLALRPDGKILAAGITDIVGFSTDPSCPKFDGICAKPFGVAVIDPRKWTATDIYHAGAAVLANASIALQQGKTLYIGAFRGEHLLKVRLR
ncbi:hypothetical protein GCM10009087_50850 [Sphingomonas oligophenolica]